MSAPRAPGALRAISFDFWDTLYDGAALPERVAFRRAALRRLVQELGHEVSEDDFLAVYRASGEEAERWWREEQRGYHTRDRIRWLLDRLGVTASDDCAPMRAAVDAVDAALERYPSPLLPGAAGMLHRLAERYELVIVSDTGFASGRAQDRLLERDGLLPLFAATVYSMDIGHCKPRPEPFAAALDSLRVAPAQVLHVGDNERTDVGGALAAGMRAARLDMVRQSGASEAELVARTFEELETHLA